MHVCVDVKMMVRNYEYDSYNIVYLKKYIQINVMSQNVIKYNQPTALPLQKLIIISIKFLKFNENKIF